MRVLTCASAPEVIARAGGAKGRNLYELTRSGLAVPPWAILSLPVFTEFLRHNRAEKALRELLDRTTVENADDVAVRVAELIEGGEFSPAAAEALAEAYAQVDPSSSGPVAVRSSGLEEDGTNFSFAGQFASFLNVVGVDALRVHVKKCWASAFSARSLHYRRQHGLATSTQGVAVIVQQLVAAERSGVLFTANPVTGAAEQYVVSCAYGLGEGVVSGAVDADTLTLDARTGAVLDTVVGDKRERFDPAADGPGCAFTEVAAADREAVALSPADTSRLHRTGERIAALFGGPCDIEWAIAGGEVWVLQSRPITTRPGVPAAGERRIWDNSNIIESFSGVTSPLTYSFAAYMYGKVYRGYAEALRVPRRQLRQMDEWLPYMLGYVHGRVYYNLLHWYRMVRLAPVYRLNRRVLEASLGVEEPLPDAVADALYPYTFRSRLTRLASRAVTVAVFTRRFVTMVRDVDRFLAHFSAAHAASEDVDYDALPAEEVHRRFRAWERDLARRWGPMMTLDAALLLSVGTLHLLTRRWLPDAPEWVTWGVASPGAEVESIEPARALRDLAATVRADPDLTRLVETTPPGDFYAALRAEGHTAFAVAVDRYLAAYGYRSLDELKLEVPDLREDPSGLFVMLRGALHEPPASSGEKVETYLREHLHGVRRVVYHAARRRTGRLLAARERLRFARTRAFGTAKRMLRAIGRDLARAGLLERWEDVFLLRLEELHGLFEGTAAHAEVKELVALRRRVQEADAALTAPTRFTTEGLPCRPENLDRAGWNSADGAPTGLRELRGIPSSAGVAEGRAVVSDTPYDLQGNVRGGILLTYRTDPGWVAALPSAAALVIERGSPLTHVAIVARELGIPTVVQVKGVTREIRTGMRLRVDGGAGVVTVLDPATGEEEETT